MPAIAEAAIQIVPDFDRFGRELDTGVKRSLRGVRSTLGGMVKMATQFGTAVGGAMAIIGASSIKAQAEFEKNIQMIEGLVGITDPAQLKSFKDAIAEIAPATGQSAQDLAKAMFFITSAGARGQTAIEILDSTARLGAAGLGDLSEIARGVVSAVNAYGEENMNAAQAADIFANTVRLGNLEAASLAPVLGQVIPIASQMGVGFDQVGGALAGLTRLGMSAAESTTSLRATLSQILSPSVQSEQALASVGLSFQQLRDALSSGKLDLLSVLQLLQDSFEGNTAAIAEAFPNLRALRGVLGLVGSNMEDNRMIMDAMRDSTGVANEAFEAQEKTLQFNLNQMMSAYRTMLIKVGEAIQPYLIPILDALTARLEDQSVTLPKTITKFMEYFNLLRGDTTLDDFTKNMLARNGEMTLSQFEFAQKIVEFRNQVKRIFDKISESLNVLSFAFKLNFGDLMGKTVVDFKITLEEVVDFIILGIESLTTFLSVTAFPKIRQFIDYSQEQFERFKPILQETWNRYRFYFDEIKNYLVLLVSSIQLLWERHGEKFMEIITNFLEAAKRMFDGIFNAILGLAKIFIALFTGDFEVFKEGVIQLFTGLWDWLVGSFKYLIERWKAIIYIFANVSKNLFDFGAQGIIEIFKWLWGKIKEIAGNIGDLIVNWAKDTVKSIGESFASGFVYVFQKFNDFINFLSDVFDKISDTAKLKFDILENLFKIFSLAAPGLITKMFDNIKEFFAKGFEWLSEKVNNFGVWIVSNGFGKWINETVEKVKDFFKDLKDRFVEYLATDGIIATFLRGGLEGIKLVFIKPFNWIVEHIKGLFNVLKDFIYDWINSGFGTAINNLFNTIKDRIASGINSMIAVLNKIIDKYNQIVPGPDIPKVPSVDFGGLEKGGNVGSGGLAVIGESGPELVNIPSGASVTPLPSVGGMGVQEANMFAAALAKQVNVVIELDSDIIAQKTAPIMVDTIRLKQGITIV